jgi:hypothetical protein
LKEFIEFQSAALQRATNDRERALAQARKAAAWVAAYRIEAWFAKKEAEKIAGELRQQGLKFFNNGQPIDGNLTSEQHLAYLKFQVADTRYKALQALEKKDEAQLGVFASAEDWAEPYPMDPDPLHSRVGFRLPGASNPIDEVNAILGRTPITDGEGKPVIPPLSQPFIPPLNPRNWIADLRAFNAMLVRVSDLADSSAYAAVRKWRSATVGFALGTPERRALGFEDYFQNFGNLMQTGPRDYKDAGPAYGPGIIIRSQAANIRFAKMLAAHGQVTVRVNNKHPGSEKVAVELIAELDGTGFERGVEVNIVGGTEKRFPGDNEDEVRDNLMYEAVAGLSLGGEVRMEWSIPRAEYDTYLRDIEKENSGVAAAEIFWKYLDKFPQDYVGYDFGIFARAYTKAYGSVSLADFVGKMNQLRPLLNMAGMRLPDDLSEIARNSASLIGAYGELGGTFKVGLTWQHYDSLTRFDNATVDANEMIPGARDAVILKFQGDGRALAAGSVVATGAGIGGDFSVMAGIAWNYGDAGDQKSYMAEVTGAVLNPNGMPFVDKRWNAKAGDEPSITGAQAAALSFSSEGGTSSIEVRESSPDDGALTYAQDLKRAFTAAVQKGSAPFRLYVLRNHPDYKDLFAETWENEAKRAYEVTVRGGRRLSPGAWDAILGGHLSGDPKNRVDLPPLQLSGERGPDLTGDWATHWLIPGQQRVYADWDRIRKKFLDEKLKELEELDYKERTGQLTAAGKDKLYKYYFALGLRPPGVYLGIYKSDGDEVKVSGGFSASFPGEAARDSEGRIKLDPKTNKIAMAKHPLTGLYQGIALRQNKRVTELASLAATPEASPEFNTLLQTPGVREALLQYYNRYGEDRKYSPIEDGTILSVLLYDGVTPTRQMRDIEVAAHSGRDLAKLKHIYRVQGGDNDFTTIGRYGLAKVTGRDPGSISIYEAEQYGRQIKLLNFKNRDPEFGPFTGIGGREVFENALLILPQVPRSFRFFAGPGR